MRNRAVKLEEAWSQQAGPGVCKRKKQIQNSISRLVSQAWKVSVFY